jgi:hypothetical protein
VTATVIDYGGNKYYRDEQAEDQLPSQPRFEKRISPAESFEKEIVFDLPRGVSGPLLDIRAGYPMEAMLIGDEDSILHKRNYFQLSEQAYSASVK